MRAVMKHVCALNQTCTIRNAALASALLLSLSACDTQSTGSVSGSGEAGSIVQMAPPPIIAQSRAILPSALVLRVSVNGNEVPMVVDATSEVWTGKLLLPAGTETTIDILWSENFQGQVLELAEAAKTIDVTLDPTRKQEVRFLFSDFDSNFDEDQDERSNLQERNADTNPYDALSPGTPVLQVPVVVRFELPDARILDDADLLASITPVATFNNQPLALQREGQSWIGRTTAPQDSSGFVAINFYQSSDQSIRIATAQRSQDVGSTNAEFNFAPDFYETSAIDRDNDDLSNLEEVLQGFNPFDSNSPAKDPCLISAFEFGCTIDTDGDGDWDSQETETADTDGDNIPDYLEPSNFDKDDDGWVAELDANEDDPCIPSLNSNLCRDNNRDSDGDGKTDVEEGEGDRDNDGIADKLERSDRDVDNDGESDESDAANNDPCVPNNAAQECLLRQNDFDGDGKTDIQETTTNDVDGDGKPDYQESSLLDNDQDGRVDETDSDDGNPCIPNNTNSTCLDAERDTDGDGKLDQVETLTNDTDNDGIPDFRESDDDDSDSDGVVDELDPANNDACIPSSSNSICQSSLDADSDGRPDNQDNCPTVSNSDQLNTDGDSQGNACDSDDDNDGVMDTPDNCPLIANPGQTNTDENFTIGSDLLGDLCDDDDDGDGVDDDAPDNCPIDPNPDQDDADQDGIGDECDTSTVVDTDSDGVFDDDDNCPMIANPAQTNTDENFAIGSDDLGDLCDDDDDGDGFLDTADNCALIANPDQTNTDENFTVGSDLLGDACDSDDDGDGVDDDEPDNCPLDPITDQFDADMDTIGDECDPTP